MDRPLDPGLDLRQRLEQHPSSLQSLHATHEQQSPHAGVTRGPRAAPGPPNEKRNLAHLVRWKSVTKVFALHVLGVGHDEAVTSEEREPAALLAIVPRHGHGVQPSATVWIEVDQTGRSERSLAWPRGGEAPGLGSADARTGIPGSE